MSDNTINKPTIHQETRTLLLNCYGKYMNKQMYAELWKYTLDSEQSLTQYDELKAKVKKYFEIKHRGILNIDDSNEHRKLLDEIMGMVGITTFDKDDDLNKQEI